MNSPAVTHSYTVPGISCDHCKHAIESEVGTVAVTADQLTAAVGDKE